MWVSLLKGVVSVGLQLYHDDELYALFFKILHNLTPVLHTVETETPEVEYVELSEEQQPSEEVIVIAPETEEVVGEPNFFVTSGKPRCIYTYWF